MGLPAEKLGRRATYADYAAVPEHKSAEIINGVLHVFPKPAPAHSKTASRLGSEVNGPFDIGRGGPGGWHILDEPELHFGPKDDRDILAPDIAGWRIERMPVLPRTAYFTLAPDWVCEVLSPSTEKVDRIDKMPIYARERVKHVWLVHPIRQTIEVFTLNADGFWVMTGMHAGNVHVRIPPFDAIELDLGLLWPVIEGGPPTEDEAG
ncbi:MAG: Uma2 family endonuclease [Polyangiaceae bacterium]|nr:Uma2 family endonuclease [Polyangiaceae bacterium]